MNEDRPELSDQAPVLGTWRRVYAAELAILAAVIGGLSALTCLYR